MQQTFTLACSGSGGECGVTQGLQVLDSAKYICVGMPRPWEKLQQRTKKDTSLRLNQDKLSFQKSTLT